MRRVLICAAVVAATWAAPLGMRTPLAQTAADDDLPPIAEAAPRVEGDADALAERRRLQRVLGGD